MRFDEASRQNLLSEGEPKHVRRNALLGYSVIVCFAIISMFFVFNNMRILVQPSQSSLTTEKSRAANQIFFNLYESECIVSEIFVTPEIVRLYQDKTKQIYNQLDTLKLLFYDHEQDDRIDSIATLLMHKEQNVLVIARLARQSSIEDIYKKNLSIATSDYDVQKYNRVLEHSRTTKNDTMVFLKIEKKKRSFFNRLASIFSSEKRLDTTIKVMTNVSMERDSVLDYYNAADTINAILDNIKDKVDAEKKTIMRGLNNRLWELELSNQEINHLINVIMRDIQNEELNEIMAANIETESSLKKIWRYMGYLSVIVIFLGFLFLVMLWRDVKKGKRYRKNMAKANAATLKLMEDREKLMTGIAHDIKAPLSSMIGYIELMNNNKITTKQAYYLNGMKLSAQHIQRLVSDVLDFNRLESGSVSLSKISFPCKTLFSEVATFSQPLANGKNLTFLYECECDEGCEILVGDPLRIKQITTNIVSNALKFTTRGSVSLLVSAKKRSDVGGGAMLMITVKDTGIGISKENLNDIFKEYVRAYDSEVAKTEGVGLGLSIVKKLVDMHGGSVAVESEKDKGTTFVVSLPLKVGDSAKKVDIDKRQVSEVNILFVDDDKMQLTIMREMLRSQPVVLETCDDVFEALNIMAKKRFDIVFSDIQIPKMNGFEFVRQIRNMGMSWCNDIVVIAISARADVDLTFFRENGFTDFLPKPFTDVQLKELIYRYIDVRLESSVSSAVQGKFSKMLQYAGGDKSAEVEILASFKEESKKHLTILRQSLSQGNISEINRTAHKMLSIFRLLEDARVSTWLSSLEICPKIEDIDVATFEDNLVYIESTYEIES